MKTKNLYTHKESQSSLSKFICSLSQDETADSYQVADSGRAFSYPKKVFR